MSSNPAGISGRISSWDTEWLQASLNKANADLMARLSTSDFWVNVDYAHLGDCEYAYTVLDHARRIVEGITEAELPRHSPLAWLFLLRELPDELFGWSNSTPVTILTVRDLCEYITAPAPARISDRDAGRAGLVFAPSVNGVAALLSVVAGAQMLKRLHAMLRVAAKGVAFRASGVFPPDPVLTSSQQSAIELYDRRIGRLSTGTLLHSGIDLMAPASLLDEVTTPGSILIVSRLARSEWIQVPDVPGGLLRGAFSLSVPSLSPLAAFTQSVGGRRWYGEHAPALAALLRVALRLILDRPGSALSVMDKGVLHFPTRAVLEGTAGEWYGEARDSVEAMFAPASLPDAFETALQSLEQVRPSIWPMRPGAVLRADRPAVALDLHAASHALMQELSMPVLGGDFDNARGELFETGVQAMIDGSPWGDLPPSLRKLRGRMLKDTAGNPITDLDAIGYRGRTLLLVDCLSNVPQLDANNMGDYKAYRNAASRVEDKVSGDIKGRRHGWRTKIDRLVGQRGANFDFTQYDSAVGVVTTPSPIYVEQSLIGRPAAVSTTETAPGLLWAATLAELEEWLHRPS